MICQKNNCNYNEYYLNQAGGNLDISYYNRLASQQGSGFFSTFAKRYGVPILKYILKQGINVGKDLIQDVAEGKKLSQATKSQIKKRTFEAINDISNKMRQKGGGIRKKPKIVKTKGFMKKGYKRKKISTRRRKKLKPRKKVKSNKNFKINKDIFK